MARLFGTDGVRGIANRELTNELAYNLGRAGAQVLTLGRHKPVIIVGRDPRASGDMLSCALMAGICAVGAHAIDVGVVTTPAIAMLIRSKKADAGVMITASHNPAEHNGIKFFDSEGYKLSDALEDEIEAIIRDDLPLPAPTGSELGRIETDGNAQREYIDILKKQLPVDLSGLTLVLDCANGAASHIAPKLFKELGAKVIATHAAPNGININDGCGSTHPKSLQMAVLEHGADAGLAFDGDSDRLIAVDDLGNLVEGDHMLVICAAYLKSIGRLEKNTVVTTVMSNMGFDIAMKRLGIQVVRTAVGDRYVLDEMLKNGYTLGGENSGHVIFLEHNSTGDGLLVGMQLMDIVKKSGMSLSKLAKQIEILPQTLVNVEVDGDKKHAYADDDQIASGIREIEEKLAGEGRVLVRPSGTEALVRIMIEGKDQTQIEAMAHSLKQIMQERLR